jgi:hypothetical protein
MFGPLFSNSACFSDAKTTFEMFGMIFLGLIFKLTHYAKKHVCMAHNTMYFVMGHQAELSHNRAPSVPNCQGVIHPGALTGPNIV